MKTVCMSFAVCLTLLAALNCSAEVTGEFKDVSFWATDGGRKFIASGGTGTLKNEKSETIAEGELKDVDETLTIRGKRGASFVHQAKTEPFAADAYSKKEVTEFATVEFGEGNRWTLKDQNFLFVLEVPMLNRPQIVPSLDRCLARASLITLPKGVVQLWGYTITVEKERGTVKFAHGKIIEASDASYNTPEQEAWEQVDSLSKQSLQNFLKKFPDGKPAQQARTAIELQDKVTTIKEGKSKDDFAISLDVLGERWKAWQKRMPEKGVVGYFTKKGEGISTLGWFCPDPLSGGKTPGRGTCSFDERGILVSPTGDGSIVAFSTDGLKFELVSGLVFETATEEPIYFGVIEGKGLVHLKGAGKVTLPDGKIIDLK
ncbi:MAG: hypothetical protein WBD05_06200 [Phycisphaerae bacterium]